MIEAWIVQHRNLTCGRRESSPRCHTVEMCVCLRASLWACLAIVMAGGRFVQQKMSIPNSKRPPSSSWCFLRFVCFVAWMSLSACLTGHVARSNSRAFCSSQGCLSLLGWRAVAKCRLFHCLKFFDCPVGWRIPHLVGGAATG